MTIRSATRRVGALVVAGLVLVGLLCSDAGAAPAHSNWTKGHRRILVIPVRFTDAAGPSDAVDPNGVSGWGNFTNGTTIGINTNFFLQQSYSQFEVDFTVLPEMNLGVSVNYYTSNYPGSPAGYTKWVEWGKPGSLADDARAKAKAAGLTNGQAARFDSANYDLDIIAVGYLTQFSGGASDGGRTVLAANFNALPHEICHCLGLQHANGTSRASGYSPVKSGSFYFDAYGDVYDLMGYKMNTRTTAPPPNRDVNPFFKYQLGWLTDSNIASPNGVSGTYRVHAFDQGVVEAGKNYALRVSRDSAYTYWFSFRQAITNLPDSKWSQSGLEVRYGGESARASSGATMMWDTTPGSRGCITTNFIGVGPTFATMHDAPLQIGRTYTDAGINLHVTPIKKGGTSPESLDVVVNFGPFPGNQAPTLSITPTNLTLGAGVSQTFTATAADRDGDTLSYYWEFDDNTVSGGTDFGGMNPDARFATNGSHVWTQNGVNFVRCTVSDMKGHIKTVGATVTITNGIAAPFTISGILTDESGNPLEGALVNNFRSGVSYGATNFVGSSATAADGKYLIVVPKTNATYKLSALYQGYSFSNSLGGTVNVASVSVSNINFTRSLATRTISGGVYTPGGWIYDSPVNGNLWISNGVGQSLLVSNGFWQMSVPDGTWVSLTATSTNPLYSVSCDFPQPYLVVDDANTLSFFVDIPGSGPHSGFSSSGATSDDTVGTVPIPVAMTLPSGQTNWVQDQYFSYTIDPSSTAEYGVDYQTSGGLFAFYKNLTPSPWLIPLTIFHNSVPKNKTVVFKLKSASSIANLGPITTFTYTISNPPPPVSAVSVTNGVFNLTWPGVSAARYTIESSPSLNPAAWTSCAPHTNLSGLNGAMTRSVVLPGVTNGFFRVRIE